MPQGQSRRLRDIVAEAARLPVEQRYAYLRRVCGTDRALYKEALAAFQIEVEKPEWWHDPAPPVMKRSASGYAVGEVIGDYLITDRVGQGGMSDVVKAVPRNDQTAPPVAIKLIRNAIAAPHLHSRLKIERAILAALNHPNIARFLDGGSTPDGQPFLVMEYIEGEQIDLYCDRRRLPVAERLQLFATVCHAVQHAHQQQVLHRDLKPSNIIVTPDGVPKLLDFGIAKILDQRRLDHTMVVTQLGFRMLTPDHASPEQVRGDLLTHSSDIYVLGVLLYELLASRVPYEKDTRNPASLQKAVCTLPPVTLIEALEAAARREGPVDLGTLSKERSTSPIELKELLSGELNDIVLKALAKEPSERYATAEEFAGRIDKYLAAQRKKDSVANQRLWPWIVYPMLAAVVVFALLVWVTRGL
jgi:serine/threonine protein kinase